ncbi:conserved Plasmodium protein, unknown function [Plasmodium ovale wallikeri]|uniref:Protein phosphatase 1 regulatory subunit 21 N-terminal domain-containing protein n=1 Tax=Plasmodium ovale wallikeri TaxID=864142 RepID=A0A1A8YHQ9_PLAOA|nr:conserved Plasmodium protein, unknown function [Plasmodium ovale wallikeri]SBT31700.1 conserved Plasmodium protein, unknown function [Plasmodium ovale wallikeri]
MNIEDKYKLIKEKYKEIKEQNDILKKAIIEYKKDIKQLEKKNDEQNSKINIILDKNSNLISSNNELTGKVTQLSNSLEEQKKSNSGWRNLMLLTKGSKENLQESVALEELEMKIKENEALHNKIDDLHDRNKMLERELDTYRNNHKDKLNEKERTIENLNDVIRCTNDNIMRIESEKEKMRKQIEVNKIQFNETLEVKNKHIIRMETVCRMLKNKCYPRYKSKINEYMKCFQSYISDVIEKIKEYLTALKELFAFQEMQFSNVYQKMEKEKRGNYIDYSKFLDLQKISQKEVACLEGVINLLELLKAECHENEDDERTKTFLRNIADEMRKFFLNVNVYLCIEEYLFPTYMSNKQFSLKNVTRELRHLKGLILKIINTFSFVVFVGPYNYDKIVAHYFEGRNVRECTDGGGYTIGATYDVKCIDNWSAEEENANQSNVTTASSVSGESEDHVDNLRFPLKRSNFRKLLCEREETTLSKHEHLRHCVEKNNKIIVFLLKKIKILLEDICYSFKYIKTYISFRICEVKGSDILNPQNSTIIMSILDLTNSLINYVENFDMVNLQLPVISLLSYSRLNNCITYKNQSNHLEKINESFLKKKIIPYELLKEGFTNKEVYQKNILAEFKTSVMTNRELQLNNEFLANSLSHKREVENEKDSNSNVEMYAEKVLNFVTLNNSDMSSLNVQEKQLIEAYICSCVKINKLNLEIKKNMEILEQLQNGFATKEDEIKKLNLQIEICKEEETNIHKKYEEQMNTLHDLIVTLEKQISKLNSEKNVHKFFILCSICGNKNNMGNFEKLKEYTTW